MEVEKSAADHCSRPKGGEASLDLAAVGRTERDLISEMLSR